MVVLIIKYHNLRLESHEGLLLDALKANNFELVSIFADEMSG